MKKQNFIITSLFLFWVIGTTTAQTITGKGYKHPCTTH